MCIWRSDLRLHLREAKKVFFTVGAICGDHVTSDQKRIYLALFFFFPQLQEEAEAEEEEEDVAGAEEEGVLGDNVSHDYCFKVIRDLGYFLYRFCLFMSVFNKHKCRPVVY